MCGQFYFTDPKTLDTSNCSDQNVDKNVNSDSNVDKQGSDNAFTSLRLWNAKNKDRLTIGSLNINSLQNKIDDLRTLVMDNLDILVVEDTL